MKIRNLFLCASLSIPYISIGSYPIIEYCFSFLVVMIVDGGVNAIQMMIRCFWQVSLGLKIFNEISPESFF